MSELTRRLIGKVVIVALVLPGITPLKGTLTAIDDRFAVLEHIKGTHAETLYIPLTSVLYIVEHHE